MNRQVPPPPGNGRERQGYRIPCPAVVHDLNTYWQRTFAAVGASYRAPTVATLTAPVVTACGPAGPEHLAFYCPAEEGIYYAPTGLEEHRRRISDFAPIVVLAHEWGHHLQTLLGITPRAGNTFELQADCLAGAYASDAGQRGLLDPGDITDAGGGRNGARSPRTPVAGPSSSRRSSPRGWSGCWSACRR
jgi:predicted metalloprotease